MALATKLDLGFPIPKTSDPLTWRGLDTLFLPGRPRHITGGERVWLRHGDRFVYSYEIKGVIHEDQRISTIDGVDLGPGPSLELRAASGRAENKPLTSIRDPQRVMPSWGRGLRYLTPGAASFVRVGVGGASRERLPRLIAPDYGKTEPTEVITKSRAQMLDRVEAKLIKDYIAWMRGDGKLKTLAIPIGTSGNMRADLYNRVDNILIEAKASAGRNHVRLAVGQLLDYVRHPPEATGSRPALAVLVPAKPEPDLMGYLASVKVAAIWRSGTGFMDSARGHFTKRFNPRRSG